MNTHKQVYACLLTGNAGATQAALVAVWKHFWCVDMAALLVQFMNKKLFIHQFNAVLSPMNA